MTFEVELAWVWTCFLVTWLWASYLFSPSLPSSICSLKLIQAYLVLLHFAIFLFTDFCVLFPDWRQDLALAERLQHTTVLLWSGTEPAYLQGVPGAMESLGWLVDLACIRHTARPIEDPQSMWICFPSFNHSQLFSSAYSNARWALSLDYSVSQMLFYSPCALLCQCPQQTYKFQMLREKPLIQAECTDDIR